MKGKLRIPVNIALAALVFWAWGGMLGGIESGRLSATGIESLQYFTVLSNLLAGFSALAYLLCRLLNRGQRGTETLKHAAAAAVGLTMVTVFVFLGPLYGYASMFEGANLWLHLVIPVVALLEALFLAETPLTRRESLWAVLPVLLYGVYYILRILLKAGEDFYGFLLWGWPVGGVILLIILGVTYLISLGLRKGSEKLNRGEEKP